MLLFNECYAYHRTTVVKCKHPIDNNIIRNRNLCIMALFNRSNMNGIYVRKKAIFLTQMLFDCSGFLLHWSCFDFFTGTTFSDSLFFFFSSVTQFLQIQLRPNLFLRRLYTTLMINTYNEVNVCTNCCLHLILMDLSSTSCSLMNLLIWSKYQLLLQFPVEQYSLRLHPTMGIDVDEVR